MNILINATSARLGGGITVIRNLLAGFLATDGGQHRYNVVAHAEVWPGIDPGDGRVWFSPSPLGGHGGVGRVLMEHIELPLRAAFQRADVMLCPGGMAVPASPVPQVVMFQNMAPFDKDVLRRYAPAYRKRLLVLRHAGLLSAHLAKRTVFISDFARGVIEPMLGAAKHRARRIYLGRDPAFDPAARARAVDVLPGLGLAGRYLLCVSQFYCYKNLVELVIGFARALPSLPGDVTLAIAGAEHEADYAAAVRSTIAREGVGDRVRLLGNVRYQDLPPLYAAAELCVFPSACENFPNILIEGMAAGAPTLASRLASMPELAGDGAMYFDPFDPDDIAAAIVRLWQDEPGRAALRARGIAQAGRYTWQACARDLLDVLTEATA